MEEYGRNGDRSAVPLLSTQALLDLQAWVSKGDERASQPRGKTNAGVRIPGLTENKATHFSKKLIKIDVASAPDR